VSRATASYRLEAEDKSAKAFRSFRGNLQKSVKGLGSLGVKIAAVVGIGGIGAMAKQSLAAADRIQKLSIASGLSTEFLSEMRLAASLTGTNLESVAKGAGKMQVAIKNASDGLQANVRTFDQLHLSVADMMKLRPDEQFEAVVFALGKVKNAAKRVALGREVFGKSGDSLQVLVAEGLEGLRKMRAEAREMGLSMTRAMADSAAAANDAMDRLAKSIQGIVEQITIKLAPSITEILESIRKNIGPVVQAVGAAASFVGGVQTRAAQAGALVGAASRGEGAVAASIAADIIKQTAPTLNATVGGLFPGGQAIQILRGIFNNTLGGNKAVAGA